MTTLPIAPCGPHSGMVFGPCVGNDSEAAGMNIGNLDTNLRPNDELSLLRAFHTFSEAAASLEHSYGELRTEVARLRRELEESHTGLERSLEENRKMRVHLDRILAGLPCGVLVVSRQGEIRTANSESVRLLRLENECGSAGGGLVEDCLAPDRLAPEMKLLLDSAQRAQGGAEIEVRDHEGEGRWLAARHAWLDDEDSAASIFILQDVSERKRLEQAQQKLRREQALAEMSAVLAHEIRNPLGSLELFAGLLAESVADSEGRKWIEQIQAGLRVLAATVNNVLHFHSLPEPERSSVDVGRLLDWAQEFFAPLTRQSHVELICEHGLAGVEIAADRHRLEQVLLNLVLNAVRAMPGGGEIRVSGRRSGDGAGISIVVADSGPGIPREQIAKIFEPGFSTRASSPGLGLAVCRKIVEQHGGTMAVESRPGQGASFTVLLPVDQKKPIDEKRIAACQQ